MSKKVYLKQEGTVKLREGVNLVGDAVGSTLGPSGRPVIISPGYGHMPITTKDGVTVAKSIFIEDEVINTGVFLIRKAASKTVDDCGDGTTTSTVLAQSIINQGLDAVAKGSVNPIEVKSGIEKAVARVTEKLKEMSISVNADMITNVATVSANNDVELGKMIGEAYAKIGNSGMLTIEDSGTCETYVRIVEGSEMARGFGNEKFATNAEKMLVEFENPMILVCDYEVKTLKDLVPLMKEMEAMKINLLSVPLVIIARGFEGEPFNTFLANKIQNGMKICLIQAPSSYQKEALSDVATIVGAKLISEDNGIKVENACMAFLGTCKKLVSSRASTSFIEGAGSKEEVESVKKQIAKLIADTDNVELKEIFEKRSARLSGSIGVIHVGGATDIEKEERKFRVDDANRAVKSAIEEGVVVGGGVALIRCMESLNDIIVSGDEVIGVTIVREACEVPLRKMLKNAGLPESIVVAVKDQDVGNMGYNVKTKEFVNMFEDNILDPTKVVRCALQNASSVACQVITSDALIVELKPS